ncbi:MAG: hypothetical protein LUE12_00465 [Ruminococcus sp.]|nr:hypothetical protein [Ruminococcus sp.]
MMRIYNTKENPVATVEQLRTRYYKELETINNRIDEIRHLISGRPNHTVLKKLELRLDTLYQARKNLQYAAEMLDRLAAPPPLNPSLAAREKERRNAANAKTNSFEKNA